MGWIVLMAEHGLRVFAGGLVLHGDGRRRVWSEQGVEEIPKAVYRERGPRGKVTALTRASGRRLELIVASAAAEFHSLITLTYHAVAESWEGDAERNGRIVLNSKRDLNRFLSALRSRLGAYVWVQEFQTRGVVHYHLLCEREIEEHVAALAWCRATDALDDAQALRHAVKVEAVKGERQARSYLGRYIGKARQKLLPEGVGAAGRWWGRSRSLRLSILAEAVVLAEGETVPAWVETRVVRGTRRYVSGQLGFRFRGGTIVDWSGRLVDRVAQVVAQLSAFYAAQVPNSALLRGQP